MAAELRRRRVETRRLCEDRRQLLDMALLQLRDDRRLQPQRLLSERKRERDSLRSRYLPAWMKRICSSWEFPNRRLSAWVG